MHEPETDAVFRAASARGGSWAEAAKACVDALLPLPAGTNLGFLYVTEALGSDLGSILTFLRERTRIADWVGSVGLGVVGHDHEYFGEPAVAVLTAALPPEGFRVFGPGASSLTGLKAALGDWYEAARPMLGVVHGDPRATNLPATVASLAQSASLFLVGGLAAAATPAQIAGRIVEGGLSGVLLASTLEAVTGLSQGCAPIGPVRRITAARGNVVMAIDERPALDVLKEDMGELLARDLRRAAGAIFAGFPVAGSDTGDYLVRNLVAIDPPRGWIAVAEQVAMGDAIIFCRRDPASALADLERMLADVKRRAGGPPKAGLYFTCIARGPNLFGEGGRELAAIRAALGEFPLAGFFGNGEIASDRIYGYTGVLALFL